MKKCPKCGIIIEKNKGCNHITCIQCGYQWCWLCNQQYTYGHFSIGKCKGFQFFQPKNDYEIKLLMEGKIYYNNLSNSQRQNIEFDNNPGIHQRNNNHAQGDCIIITCFFVLYIFFGNFMMIILEVGNEFPGLVILLFYFLLSIAFFFQMIFLNIIVIIFIFIFIGMRSFYYFNFDTYTCINRFFLIIVHLISSIFLIIFHKWKELINNTNISLKYFYFNYKS